MSTQTRLMTADEFAAMPDDNLKHELIRGELITMSLPKSRHGRIALKIGRLLANHAEPLGLGEVYSEVGYLIEQDPDTVRGPDTSFVSHERLAEVADEGKYFPFAPDLAVEVVSPNDRPAEVREKAEMWVASGARLVWVADPEKRTVTIYRPGAEPIILSEQDEIEGGDVLLGFRCRVADFFA